MKSLKGGPMAKLFISTMKTDTVKYIMEILRKLQITTSKLYHNGQFNEELSDEFFEVEEMLNY